MDAEEVCYGIIPKKDMFVLVESGLHKHSTISFQCAFLITLSCYRTNATHFVDFNVQYFHYLIVIYRCFCSSNLHQALLANLGKMTLVFLYSQYQLRIELFVNSLNRNIHQRYSFQLSSSTTKKLKEAVVMVLLYP